MKSAEVVYFSPHLDDAVFSCAGTICKQAASGKSVLVVTVFSADSCGVSAGRSANYERRAAEDIAAVAACGASHHHLGLLDAPFRNMYYHDLTSIFYGMHADDFATISALREKMEQILADSGATAAYFPLGISGHIDHRLTFSAAWTAAFSGKKYYYEDRPYVFFPGNPHRRLRQLGLSAKVIEEAAGPKLIGLPYLGLLLNLLRDLNLQGDYSPSLADAACCLRRYLTNKVVSPTLISALTPQVERFDPVLAQRALYAVSCYPTQVAAISGTLARWQRCSERYSRVLGAPSAERCWTGGALRLLD